MSNLSSFYPQPIVAGTTDGTYAEGDDPRIVGAAQKSANLSDLASASTARANIGAAAASHSHNASDVNAGTLSVDRLPSIISTRSNTARSIPDRFIDNYINILDFGADPTGATDSWLSIQRAVLAASADPELSPVSPATITEATTHVPFTGWPSVPYMYSRVGRKFVYLPKGNYLISKPIVTNQATKIIGDSARQTKIIKQGNGDFAAFEDFWHWTLRSFPNHNWTQSNPIWIGTPWMHRAYFGFFSIENQNSWNGVVSTPPPKEWMRCPTWGDSAENGNPCQAIQGGTSITTTLGWLTLRVGDKIKFRGLNDVYTVASYSGGKTITTVEPIVTEPNGANLQKEEVINNGIVVAGGEELLLENIYIGGMNGYGIYCYYGSPGITWLNGMINGCRVAYKIESGTSTLIRPSGDNNSIFVEVGMESVSNVDVYSPKIEGGQVDIGTTGTTYAPCVFRLGNISSVSSGLKIYGGTCNPIRPENSYSGSSSIANNTSFIEVYNVGGSWPVICCQGPINIGWGKNFYKEINFYTNLIQRVIPRSDSFIQYENGFNLHGSSGIYFAAQNDTKLVENTTNIVFGSHQSYNSGIILDPIVSNNTLSGIFGNVTFTRSSGSTTAEITTSTDHYLQVGDYIFLRDYSGTTPANTTLIGTSDGGVTMYYTKLFRVTGTPSSTKIQITVKNEGSESGSALMFVYRQIIFHDIKDVTHRFQMPNNIGNTTDRSAFVIVDKERRKMAGLRVATATEGQWWASKELAIGGTIDSPASRILHGTGIPSMSAPNGSLYLRTDGAADTTLYIRASGTWTPLTST